MLRILILEDQEEVRDMIAEEARNCNFRVFEANNLDDAERMVNELQYFHAITVDLNLDTESSGRNLRYDGIDFCLWLRKTLGCCVVVYSGHVNALDKPAESRDGANRTFRQLLEAAGVEILIKPQHKGRLKQRLQQVAELHRDAQEPPEFDQMLQKAALSESNVLLYGPSGCGKELAARRIAKFGLSINSGLATTDVRANNSQHEPIQTICCGAISDELLLSEMFGHVRGAFTNATEPRIGRLLRAGGWYPRMSVGEAIETTSKRPEDWFPIWVGATGKRDAQTGCYVNDEPTGYLILDELSDMPLRAQQALLRALDNYGVAPLGYDGPAFLPRFRVIGIVNDRGLDALGKPQNFLPDLRYRIEQYSVEVYNLSQRDDYVMDVIENEVASYSKCLSKKQLWQSVEVSLDLDEQAMQLIRESLPEFDADGGFRRLLAWVRRACVEAAYSHRNTVSDHDFKVAESSKLTPKRIIPSEETQEDVDSFRLEVQRKRGEIEQLIKAGGVQLDNNWGENTIRGKLNEILASGDAKKITSFRNYMRDAYDSMNPMAKQYLFCALSNSMTKLPDDAIGKLPNTWRAWFSRHGFTKVEADDQHASNA